MNEDIHKMVYSSACGTQLIRFSYATDMSCPHGNGYMQATYKSGGKYKKYHFTIQLAVNYTFTFAK